MKKSILFALATTLFFGSAMAQNKLDGPAALLTSLATTEMQSRALGNVRAIPSPVAADEKIAVLVTVADGNVLKQIERLGGEIVDVKADIAIARLTPLQIQDIAALSDVLGISVGPEVHTMMTDARKSTFVDDVQAGTGLDKAYDGSGVLCSMMDSGLEVNHLNFLNEDGSQRISNLWVITGINGAIREYSGSGITGYTTDSSTNTHATHVLGILAGGYKGKADQVAIISDRTGRLSIKKDYEVPYYGVATGAELAPCAGSLSFTNITLAAQMFADYAAEKGMPGVMNFSLGTNVGPHDGTSAVNRYLDEIGKDILITFSAGNEGDAPISLKKTFTAGDTQLKTTFSTTSEASGNFDIWSEDETPIKLTFVAVDKTSGEIKYSYTFENPSGAVYLTGTYYNNPSYIIDSKLDDIFGSSAALSVNFNVNEANNRYNAYASVSTSAGSNRNLVPGIIVEGQAGKTVYVYGSSVFGFYSNGLAGYSAGTPDCSLNDMACGENVLAVGASVNIKSWPTLGGELYLQGEENCKIGDIASFSSYGTTLDGRKLPHIVAPGQSVTASISSYYALRASNRFDTKYVVAKKAVGDREYFWDSFSGTSMASPFMAGVLALWLQADPTLTMDEVKDILKKTAINDEFTAAAPDRFGYGKVDALAGIKEVLSSTAVKTVKAEKEILVSEISRGVFDLFAPGAQSIEAKLYSISGALTSSVIASGENATIDAAGVAPGIYVLRVSAAGKTETRKVVIR